MNALYASLDEGKCTEEVVNRMKESEIEIRNLDWKEIGIYLRYHIDDDLKGNGIVDIVQQK